MSRPVLFTPDSLISRERGDFARGARVRSLAPIDNGTSAIFCLCAGGFGDVVRLRRQRRAIYGSAGAKHPASWRRSAASGQAPGSETRMRAAPSMTRAAILMRRSLRVANSARNSGERLGTALRAVSLSQEAAV